MTTTFITTNTIGAGTPVTLAANGDGALIAQGIVLGSTNSDALYGAGSYHRVTVLGTVHGERGIVLGYDPLDTRQQVVVGASGVVSGGYIAVVLNGTNSSVTNQGLISAVEAAVQLNGTNSSMTNHGLISGGINGVQSSGDAASGQSRIFNDGTIEGGTYGVYRIGTEALRIENHGTIRGSIYSIITYNTANDIVLNRGVLIGDVDLSGGNDLYDGRRGRIDGVVFGGDGNDTFIAGLSEEEFNGGIGLDLLDFTRQSGVTLSLANDIVGTGTATGDTYLGIENVTGSRVGNDQITGDARANQLRGLGGADSLAGGSGNDLLIGGAGIDTLSGGAGDDRFHFSTLAEGGDSISDFRAMVGIGDSFALQVAGFGGGLVAGALAAGQFINRADNLAQDADDRFIFRTTDQTLWFDIDGLGGGGPILIADLQAGATVTAADIFLL